MRETRQANNKLGATQAVVALALTCLSLTCVLEVQEHAVKVVTQFERHYNKAAPSNFLFQETPSPTSLIWPKVNPSHTLPFTLLHAN